MLDRAFAASNLFNLGWRPDEIKAVTCAWASRQASQSLERVSNEAARIEVLDELGEDCPGRMFLSFHYSMYPALYRALGKRTSDSTVLSLIGEQSAEHRAALQSIARSEGVNIHFVQSGFRMITEMKRGLERGFAGLVLLDIPWSKGGAKPDQRRQAYSGSFSTLSTVERLIDLIDENREVITASRGADGRVRLTREGALTFPEAFLALGKLIEQDPGDYERLHQIHRFFSFDVVKRGVTTFCIKDQRYAVVSPSMRTIKLQDNHLFRQAELSPHGLCENKDLHLSLSRATGESVEYVLCL